MVRPAQRMGYDSVTQKRVPEAINPRSEDDVEARTDLFEPKCGHDELSNAKLLLGWVWATNVDPYFDVAPVDSTMDAVLGCVRSTFEIRSRPARHDQPKRRVVRRAVRKKHVDRNAVARHGRRPTGTVGVVRPAQGVHTATAVARELMPSGG